MAVVEQARYEYTGDGVTREFPIVFPYLRDSDVVVQVDGQNVAYTFSPGNSFVRLEEVPSAGSEVVVQRSTEARYPLHEFQHGSPLVPGYLDENLKQVLYVAQELVYESEETRDVADAALQTVQDALDTASNAVDIVNNANSAASVAVGTANQALQQAGVAEGIAQAAALDASTAVDTAGTAAADAAAALSVAGTASSAAQTAVQVAGGIDSKATQALSESGDAVARVEQLESVVTDLESGGVTNFNGRIGTIVPAAGDYSYDQIAGLQDQLDSKVGLYDLYDQIAGLQGQLDSKVGLDDSVQTSGNQTISGTKTFSQFPVTPTAAPTSDYQAANKKYVDDKVYGAAQKSANLSDLASAPAARQNLGLGTAATRDVGTAAGQVLGSASDDNFGLAGHTFPVDHSVKGFLNAVLTQRFTAGYKVLEFGNHPDWFDGYVVGSGPDILSKTKSGILMSPYRPDIAFFYNVHKGSSTLPDIVKLLNTGNILTTTGQSTEYPMTQKAVTDALNNKVDKVVAVIGPITLNGTADNTVWSPDVVTKLSLEVGDVIKITTGAYNKLHTVESILDNSSIIVNYAHAGNIGSGSLQLPDFTGQATVTRVAKWFNAPIGMGQAWVNVAKFRKSRTNYENTTGRSVLVALELPGGDAYATVSSVKVGWSTTHETRGVNVLMPSGATIYASRYIRGQWVELR